MLNLNSIPKQNPDVIGRMTDDEAVLVMPGKGQVKVLNEVGARVWELIDGKTNLNQIVEEICADFDVETVNAESDILNFITKLINREMIILVSYE